jgi:isoquinoline 1-oxidoreductase beta subunit
MSNTNANTRRTFLRNISLASGGLMLGFKWNSAHAEMPAIFNAADPVIAPSFNSYLTIATDGTVNIFSPNPELGQNIMTSFAQIVAEELDADWTKVRVTQAPLDTKAFDRQLTGGSGAIPHSWMRLRKAGASARWLLLHAAAQQWGVSPEECTADNGFIIHKPSGKKLGYGELATAASTIEMPKEVPLKDSKDFKLIGKPIRNIKNKDIITGKPIYGLDFYREGMVIAMVQRPPAFGTKIKSINDAAVKTSPGILDVVKFQENVAIVGKTTWEIMKAKKLLEVEYEKAGNIESTADHDALLTSMLDGEKITVQRKDGDVEMAFKNAAKIIKSEYQSPFLPHSPLEPMNFFAHVHADGVELVGPTQTPQAARQAVAKLLNIPQEKITVDITRLGGGFGRRLKFDYVVEAAELSSIIKKPVKVIWSREDDMMGGSYRPAVRYRFEAALDASGNMIGYKLRGAGINAGNSTRHDNFPSGAVDNLLIESVDHQSPITTGAWRAPTTNFLAFAEQSFLDEVAEAAGKDSVQFRLELLEKARKAPVGKISYDIERFDNVIRTVAEKSGWGKKKGVSQGFSVYFSHASYVGQVCDMVVKDGKPTIQKIYAVSDCGQVINSSGALQQVKGAIVDGYGHAMFGKLSFVEGKPEQNNFNNYRLIRMKEIPEIDASFVDNGKDPTGLGEPALPPTGGAVANAIYKATGKRLKKQPFIEEPLFADGNS